MRYFAILRDSFREAIDSKVMYVLMALATLAILFVATLSFKPLSAQVTMEQFFSSTRRELIGTSIMFIALNDAEINSTKLDPADMKNPPPGEEETLLQRLMLPGAFRLEKVEVIRGELDSPTSDYKLTIADSLPRLLDGNQEKVLAGGNAQVRKLFKKAEELGFLKIGDVTTSLDKPGEGLPRLRYVVTVESTPLTWRIWATEPSLFFGLVPIEALAAPMNYQAYVLSNLVLSFGAWVAIIIGVVITSFFIPNMLSKGTVDLLLVKPIARWTLLLYKYIGGLSFIFLCTTYAMGGMWLALGLRTGLWMNGSLLLIITITYFFAILYAISTFIGVITRSTIAAIMLTIGAWFAFFLIGWAQGRIDVLIASEAQAEKQRPGALPPESKWTGGYAHTTVRLIHAITPHTEDLNKLNTLIIYTDMITGNLADLPKFQFGERHYVEAVIVSFLWVAVFLGLSCAWFSYKDY